MDRDAQYMTELARRTAGDIEALCRSAPPPGRLERAGRLLGRAPRALRRKGRELFREHWDLGVFDLAFGSLKAFAVYPALYFAGLAWTIALMETLLLNTQLWTAGYLILRRRLRSALGRRSLGVPLASLDELRERWLCLGPRDARNLHRFTWEGRSRVLRVRRGRLAGILARLRGERALPGVVSQAALRRMVSDPEFRFRSDALRDNPHLYEEVLVARLLAHPAERAGLLRVAAPEPRLEAEARSLLHAIGEGTGPSRARLLAQAEALREGLRSRLGGPSVAGACLRWLHASQRRIISRRMTELEGLEYRLLADVRGGRTVTASPRLPAVRRAQARIASAIARAERLVERALRVRSTDEAAALALRELEAARLVGVPARRAGLAARLLASGPEPGVCAGLAGLAR